MARGSSADGQPLVSVVVPIYNAGDRIENTLSSVVRQSYPNMELILVDDGSKDDTATKATQFLAATGIGRWRLIEQENAGPSKARNTGWRAAKGELIQFLDDDDEIDQDKIAVQVASIREATPDAALIYSGWCLRHSGQTHIRTVGSTEWRLEDPIRTDRFLPLAGCLVRKSWLEAVNGFDERFRLIEDVDLQIRILAVGGRFAEVLADKPLFFYNQRSGSLSQSSPADFVEGCLRNARLVYEIAENRKELTPALVQTVFEAYRQGLSVYAEIDRPRFAGLYREMDEKFSSHLRRNGWWAPQYISFIAGRRIELLRGTVRRTRRHLRDILVSIGVEPSKLRFGR